MYLAHVWFADAGLEVWAALTVSPEVGAHVLDLGPPQTCYGRERDSERRCACMTTVFATSKSV